MNRFERTPLRSGTLSKLAGAAFFLLVLAAFLAGLRSLSGITAKQEAEGLRDAVVRGAVHCYALEGFYPDSLAYLEEHYGLQYDRERFIVDYEIVGSNLMPDVTVIARS